MGTTHMFIASRSGFGMKAGAASIALCLAAFSISVGHIIGVCAQKEMFRITARRIVAAMKNEKKTGLNIMEKKIGHSVGSIHSAFAFESAVASGNLTGFPKPTFVGVTDFDLRPESFYLLFAEMRKTRIRFNQCVHAPIVDIAARVIRVVTATLITRSLYYKTGINTGFSFNFN